MKVGKWFELRRECDPGGLPYSWPEATRQMWKGHIKERSGRGIRKTFEALKREIRRIDPSPAILVVFPKELPISGHLASIRKTWENLQLISFDCWKTGVPMRTPGRYFGTSAVIIWTKYILRKLAETSPLFVPIWEDLKNLPAGKCGIYLADEPSATWLASIRPDEERLFDEFRGARNLDMIGLDLRKPGDEIVQLQAQAMKFLMEEKYEEGEALLRDILADWPDSWRAYWDLAMSAIWQENPSRALAVIQHAQRQYPGALNFDRLAADCAIKLKKWALAERHLKRLWGLNPWDPNLMIRYAETAFGRNGFSLSAKLYEDCMECGDLNISARINYGVSLSKIGRMKEAVAIFRLLEKEDPGNPTILNNVGFILASEGHPIEALHYCRRAVELAPDREYIWDSLGFVQLKTRNYQEATRAFLKAVDLNPTFPDAWRHLLHAYHKEGKTDRLEGAKAYVGQVLPGELARFEREKDSDILD